MSPLSDMQNMFEHSCICDNLPTTHILLLPAGWATVEDPTSGKTYYHCAATGSTQWDAPRSASAAAPPLLSLRGKVALVTGVAAGTMGGAIAEQLAAQGADIVAVDIPLPDRERSLRETAAEIAERHGVRVVCLPTDVTDLEKVEALFASAVEQLGRVDIAVATVGGGGFVGGEMTYANKLPAHEECARPLRRWRHLNRLYQQQQR